MEPRKVEYERLASSAYMWNMDRGDETLQLVQRRAEVLQKFSSPPDAHATLFVKDEKAKLQMNTLGSLLAEEKSHYLLGLFFAGDWEQHLFHYTHLRDYMPTFCVYLNLGCESVRLASGHEDGNLYLDNRISFFDRFLYIDQ